MILFVAPNPFKAKEREGFLQRVAAIDKLFEDEEKLYFDDISDVSRLADVLLKANIIYVHSAYNANKILKLYPRFSNKIITDLHGVVPEEEEYANNQEMARVMAATEREIFKTGKYFVSVSHAMIEHYRKKYNLTDSVTWITLPIFNGVTSKQVKERAQNKQTVVYAGGDQRWQNVELMVKAINESKVEYSYTILTHSPQAFSGISDDMRKKITIKSVASDKISGYYSSASFGFVLRDDMLLNHVACPTKLIEYLSHGVIPIVLSPNIGDFARMGYEYIKLDDFMRVEIADKQVQQMVKKNYQVYRAFIDQTVEGKKSLVALQGKLKRQKPSDPHISFVDLVALSAELQVENNKVLKYEFQIDEYKKKIAEYAEAAEYYKLQAEELRRQAPPTTGRVSKLKNKLRR